MQITPDQAISELIQARAEASNQQVTFAIASKQLNVQRQQGDAMVELVEQAAVVQQQIAAGRLDVRV